MLAAGLKRLNSIHKRGAFWMIIDEETFASACSCRVRAAADTSPCGLCGSAGATGRKCAVWVGGGVPHAWTRSADCLVRVSQAIMRRRWRHLVSEAHDAVVAEAVVTAVLTAAVVAAVPFSAKELAPRADVTIRCKRATELAYAVARWHAKI